jgi:hypothetical protein
MAEIRPLQQGDLPAVAALLQENLPPWTSEGQILHSLAGTMLQHPWADAELPSLVAVEDGDLIGFIGAQARRVRFDDRVLRAVCCSHLTVAPGRRGGATGALLLRRLLTGQQDFTFSDTANLEVIRMWRTFGGHLDHARACAWMVVLRPVRWMRTLAADVVLRRDLGRGQIPVGALPFHAVRRRRGRWHFPDPGPGVTGEDVDAATIVERLPEMTRGFRLRVDYDAQFLDHLFRQVEAQFGRLVRRLVRSGDRPLGWYAYVPNRRGVSRILHLLTTRSDDEADAVLADLVAHASKQGTAVLVGRHEPHLTELLQRRFPILGFSQRPVVHSHDVELLSTLATSESLLTQLDGEWFAT